MNKINIQQRLNGRSVPRASRFFMGLTMLVCTSGLITGMCVLPSVSMHTDSEIHRQDADDDSCSGSGGPAVRLPTTKLFIEHNSTDEDTGVHGAFDGVDWQKLCVFDPNGKQVLEVEPKGQLEIFVHKRNIF